MGYLCCCGKNSWCLLISPRAPATVLIISHLVTHLIFWPYNVGSITHLHYMDKLASSGSFICLDSHKTSLSHICPQSTKTHKRALTQESKAQCWSQLLLRRFIQPVWTGPKLCNSNILGSPKYVLFLTWYNLQARFFLLPLIFFCIFTAPACQTPTPGRKRANRIGALWAMPRGRQRHTSYFQISPSCCSQASLAMQAPGCQEA